MAISAAVFGESVSKCRQIFRPIKPQTINEVKTHALRYAPCDSTNFGNCTKEIFERFIRLPEGQQIGRAKMYSNDLSNEYDKLLDVLQRRSHNMSSVRKALGTKTELNQKVLNTLEFKDFEKVKDMTLETFKKLSLQEKKDFINSFISIKVTANESSLKMLPDMKLFDEIKAVKPPKYASEEAIPDFKMRGMKYNEDRKVFINKIETLYDNILESLLSEIPRGKNNIPQKELKIIPGKVLDIKPPMTNSLERFETALQIINGRNVRIGDLGSCEGLNLSIHCLDPKYIRKLEALRLTDPDAILCGGFSTDGSRTLGQRIGAVIRPKNPGELLIQGNSDMGSGYGAVKNLKRIQKFYLENEIRHELSPQSNENGNSLIPILLRKKLGLNMEQYTNRIKSLGNANYLEDVKAKDEELYNAIMSITKENKLHEGIMRPEIDAVLIPQTVKEIDNAVLDYCQRYDIPIFRVNK